MFKGTDLHAKPLSAEDSMKMSVVMPLSRDRYDQSLYFESARRVIFRRCMAVTEQTDATLPNFNKDFYYNREELQTQLETCFNTRMELHFGKHNAQKHNLFMDFAEMKHEFRNYEKWAPMSRMMDQYKQGYEEADLNAIVDRLKQKGT